jgi:GR25 family glycosyltransferase involved in LPS biosynthesis
VHVAGYVIHLERSAGRRPQAVELTRALPLPSRILPAVDGRALDEATRRRFVRRRMHGPRYPFPLLDAEVGCFLSYRRAWQAILDEGCLAGLIVEDDVAPASPSFADVIMAAAATIQPHDYIRFPLHERADRGPTARTSGGVTLREPRLPGLGMQMQLVGHEAARLLLAATEAFDRPVDSFVQMQWLHGARVLAALPIVIREIDYLLGGTVIQVKRGGIVHKGLHEVQRPILRFAVRAANERWRRRRAA